MMPKKKMKKNKMKMKMKEEEKKKKKMPKHARAALFFRRGREENSVTNHLGVSKELTLPK